ncbi:MAG: hypothetical protein J6V83_05850, partial [Clostridia bacterium]|nr:hypothetical protein [Clostridia bacterium]
MAKNKVDARFSIALLFIVLIFALTGFMLTRPSNALANSESITDSQELLTSLKNLYDHRNDAYSHEYTVDAEISLSDSETYAPYNYNDMTNASSITFYYPVKNVLNSYYEDVSQNLHYGLIKCDYYGGDNLHVYYGVTLIVGEGASINSNNITRYEYTKGATLPTASDLTAPVGKSFVKWIETDDSTETAVTTISINDWGVKSYTAIWSTLDNEQDENEGDAGNPPIPEPTSHAIKYYNLLGVDDTSLPTSYIDGIALDLPILTKVGYTFNGFVIKGSSVKVDSLSEVLNAGIVADDGSIHLSAVWSLNTPTIDSITPINKIYDGIPENITPTYSHGGDEGLTYSFSWLYSIDGTSPYVEVADTESLLVKNVNDSGFYKLRVSVTDAFSHQAQIDSSAISVNIAPIELSLTKGAITPNIAKSYDGTTSCDFSFVYGSHYILKGAVNGEINSVEYTTKFDGVNVSENRKVIVTFGALVMNEAYQSSNYVYTPNASSLTYSAKINVRNITLIANSTPDIFKTYDGTNTCNHEFKLGVDYNIDGAIGNEILGVNYTALYDTADASDNKQILFTANNLVMNDGFTSANYSALTEITFNGKI